MDHDSRTGYINVIEASLYYLQSRYYNPEIGRFINADSYTSTGSLLGNNMFAYCLNNPVMHSDATGDSPFLALIADAGVSGLVNGLVSAICTFATGGSFADVAKSFFIGFGEGFIADILNLEILFAVMGACKTVYDCLKSGADWERSAIAGTVAFFAGLGFEGTGEKYVDLMVDLTFSLGSSLSSAGITEGVQRYEGNDPSRWALPSINLGGGCGGKPMQSTVPQLVNINSY